MLTPSDCTVYDLLRLAEEFSMLITIVLSKLYFLKFGFDNKPNHYTNNPC